MSYKVDIYDNYVKHHITGLYRGVPDIKKIESRFKDWKYYYTKFLPPSFEASILDIGCGEGSFIYFLLGLGYKNASGIDISNQQIELGRSLGIKNIECGDLYEHLSSGKKYDLIIARDILEHFTKQQVYDISKLISNALLPGGKLLLQVPNGQGIFYTEVFYGDFTHEIAFTHSSLEQVLGNVGFVEVKSFPINPAPHGIKAKIRLVLWLAFIGMVRTVKSFETGNRRGIYTRNLICLAEKKNNIA